MLYYIESFQTIVQLTESTNSHEEQLRSLTSDLTRMDAKNAQLQSAGLKQENDLKKHISDLKGKLDSATHGRRAESEMYEESMAKTQRLETIMNELNAKVTSFYHKNSSQYNFSSKVDNTIHFKFF